MKIKLTAIMENDKSANGISEEQLKLAYQLFFDMLVEIANQDGSCNDKATVVSAEVMEE